MMTAEQLMRAPVVAATAATASPVLPTVFAPGAAGTNDDKLRLSALR
jgi:hypothetical protein